MDIAQSNVQLMTETLGWRVSLDWAVGMTKANEIQGLRRQVLEIRSALSSSEIQRRSGEVIQRFIQVTDQLFPVQVPLKVGVYSALGGELDLAKMESYLRGKGHRIFYPRISNSKEFLMDFVEALESSCTESHWTKNSYGILEPAQDLPSLPPDQLDLVFVPGVVFGEKGERIGRGRGYYDRFLSRAPQALRVSLVYDFQIVSELPQQAWDQAVHWIFSESRDLRTEFFNHWSKFDPCLVTQD